MKEQQTLSLRSSVNIITFLHITPLHANDSNGLLQIRISINKYVFIAKKCISRRIDRISYYYEKVTKRSAACVQLKKFVAGYVYRRQIRASAITQQATSQTKPDFI